MSINSSARHPVGCGAGLWNQVQAEEENMPESALSLHDIQVTLPPGRGCADWKAHGINVTLS
jgi:hypothetical protein